MSDTNDDTVTTLLRLFDDLEIDAQARVAKQIGARVQQNRDEHRALLMSRLHPGDDVTFIDKQAMPRRATVLRTNKKTVSLLTQDGERWNVAPELLTPAPASDLPRLGEDRRWSGGTVPMPAFVNDDDGNAYQPRMALLLNDIGQVVGFEIYDPNDATFDVVSFLQKTIANPNEGQAVAPSHLKISDKSWLPALQKAFPVIQVSSGATPEIDTVVESMGEAFSRDDTPAVYSAIGADPATVERFFACTAALYKSEPWACVPHDQCLLAVTAPELGLSDAVVSVIGQQGESFGVVLFDSLEDHERYVLLSDAIASGRKLDIPPHRSLAYEPATEIDPDVRKDIARHQWPVAGTDAYPSLLIPTADRILAPPGERDLEVFAVLATALTRALGKRPFVKAIGTQSQASVNVEVLLPRTAVAMTLETPYPYARVLKELGARDDLIAQLLLLDRVPDDEPDFERHEQLTDQLLEKYQQSKEGRSVKASGEAASLIMSLAFNYCDCTVATLTPTELEDILFMWIPRKVMIGPDAARGLVKDTKAFLRFLHRSYRLDCAKQCLGVLDQNATPRLRAALAAPSNFGMAKSIISSPEN